MCPWPQRLYDLVETRYRMTISLYKSLSDRTTGRPVSMTCTDHQGTARSHRSSTTQLTNTCQTQGSQLAATAWRPQWSGSEPTEQWPWQTQLGWDEQEQQAVSDWFSVRSPQAMPRDPNGAGICVPGLFLSKECI